MSSKDKMNVQDQSKERGVSGGLELNEEKESSPGKPLPPRLLLLFINGNMDFTEMTKCSSAESSVVSSPDSESVTTSTVSPADKVRVSQNW